MQKNIALVAITIVIVVALIISSRYNSDSLPEEFEYEKIVSKNQVPVEIWEGLSGINSLELTRGSYYFLGKHYNTEGIYFLLCGGQEFVNGYDVNIIDMRYEVTGASGNEVSHKALPSKRSQIRYGYFEPTVEEISSEKSFTYCEGFEYPFVIFKISTKVCDNDRFSRKVPTTIEGVYLENKQNY